MVGERRKDTHEAFPAHAESQCRRLVRHRAGLPTAFQTSRRGMEGEDHRRQSADIFTVLSGQDGVCDGEGGYVSVDEGTGYGFPTRGEK